MDVSWNFEPLPSVVRQNPASVVARKVCIEIQFSHFHWNLENASIPSKIGFPCKLCEQPQKSDFVVRSWEGAQNYRKDPYFLFRTKTNLPDALKCLKNQIYAVTCILTQIWRIMIPRNWVKMQLIAMTSPQSALQMAVIYHPIWVFRASGKSEGTFLTFPELLVMISDDFNFRLFRHIFWIFRVLLPE